MYCTFNIQLFSNFDSLMINFHWQLHALIGCYAEIVGRSHLKKNGKNNNVSGSLLSQHLKRAPNVAGVCGALCRTYWCDPLGGVQGAKPRKLELP